MAFLRAPQGNKCEMLPQSNRGLLEILPCLTLIYLLLRKGNGLPEKGNRQQGRTHSAKPEAFKLFSHPSASRPQAGKVGA